MQFYGTWKEIRAKSLFSFTGALILCSLLQRWSSILLLPHVDHSLICHTGAMHLQQQSCLGRLPLCLFKEVAETHGEEHFCLHAWFGIYVSESQMQKRKFIKQKKPQPTKQKHKKPTKQNKTKQYWIKFNLFFLTKAKAACEKPYPIYVHLGEVKKPHLKGII